MKIDVHSHFAPAEYIALLKNRPGHPTITVENGHFVVSNAPGIAYRMPPGMYQEEVYLADMDEAGVDMAAVSIIVPGADRVEPRLGLALAQAANEGMARLTREHPGRFVGLATLPFIDIEAALQELDRAVSKLGLKGVEIFSNVDGIPLDDPRFWPIYERAEQLDVPLLLHPTMPLMLDTLRKYAMVQVLGLLFDTTIAMTRIILSGIMERYPNLKFVLCHLGSTIPYLLGRIDYETKRHLGRWGDAPRPPSEYFKRVYIDTVSLHEPALACAYATSGPDRILFGSDYPYWPMAAVVESIARWGIAEEDKNAIFGLNARRLFRLD